VELFSAMVTGAGPDRFFRSRNKARSRIVSDHYGIEARKEFGRCPP